MLIDNQCSIYEHRPRTCRTYDCRVFAAAGLDDTDERQFGPGSAPPRRPGGSSRLPRSTHAGSHLAVRAAAAYLEEHPNVLRHYRRSGDRDSARRAGDPDPRRVPRAR